MMHCTSERRGRGEHRVNDGASSQTLPWTMTWRRRGITSVPSVAAGLRNRGRGRSEFLVEVERADNELRVCKSARTPVNTQVTNYRQTCLGGSAPQDCNILEYVLSLCRDDTLYNEQLYLPAAVKWKPFF